MFFVETVTGSNEVKHRAAVLQSLVDFTRRGERFHLIDAIAFSFGVPYGSLDDGQSFGYHEASDLTPVCSGTFVTVRLHSFGCGTSNFVRKSIAHKILKADEFLLDDPGPNFVEVRRNLEDIP